MRYSFVLVALLLPIATAIGQPPVVTEVPRPAPAKWVEIPAQPGRLVRLSAGERPAKWILIDDQTADLAPAPDGKSATFAAERGGRYRLLVLTDTEPSRFVIVVGDSPDPVPPPQPHNDLKRKLKAAFQHDKGDKTDALQLAALYREAAKLSADKAVPSSRELLRRVREAGTSLIGTEALTSLRMVVAAELTAVFGMSSDTSLTDSQRAAAAELFKRLAAILEELP